MVADFLLFDTEERLAASKTGHLGWPLTTLDNQKIQCTRNAFVSYRTNCARCTASARIYLMVAVNAFSTRIV